MEESNMKKEYIKPTVHVVQLQHQCHILTGSLYLNGTPECIYWDDDDLDDDDVLR
jgi:hypothetical protein